jgi:probable rRNA maturation factor
VSGGAGPAALELVFLRQGSFAAALLEAAGAAADPDRAEAFWTAHLGRWLDQLAPELPPALRTPLYGLGLQISDDPGIAGLNAAWRGIDAPTDVLAFAAQEEAAPRPPAAEGEAADGEPLELGDLVISLPTAARQAAEAGHGLEAELLFLASHGLLHLLGWDHPDEAALAAMLARQRRLLEPG